MRADAHLEEQARLVSVAMLIRLLALLAGVVGLVGTAIDWPTLVAIMVLGGTSLWGMLVGHDRNLALLLTAHPLLIVLDEVVNLAVLAAIGIDSPLVLATSTTALLLGLLLPLRIRLPAVFILVAGYLLVARIDGRSGLDTGFLIIVGIPAICVMLAVFGSALRRMLAERVEMEMEVSEIRTGEGARVERERLARELHDSVAKSMHGIGLLAMSLPAQIDRDVAVAKRQAEIIAEAAETASQQSRALLTRLRVDQLDRSLGDVVAGVAREWARSHRAELDLEIRGAVDVFEHDRYELLAAFSEALENVARHAGASRVGVFLHGRGNEVVLTLVDNGKGFEAEALERAVRSGHYGVVGVRERMATVGGTADLESVPGEGTTVRLVYPRHGSSE